MQDHEAIGAIIQNEAGDILVFFHKKFNFWTVPIGKADPGETAYEGLCTELREECGITVIKATEIVSHPYEYVRNSKPVRLTLHLYQVNEYKGTVKNNEADKHPVMRYMSVDEIKSQKELSDATLLYLENLEAAKISR